MNHSILFPRVRSPEPLISEPTSSRVAAADDACIEINPLGCIDNPVG